jgi:hypothetical protein
MTGDTASESFRIAQYFFMFRPPVGLSTYQSEYARVELK